MMTCREVSTLVSMGRLPDASLAVRLAVRLHLAMCRHCRAFKRQMERLTKAARELSTSLDGELADDFETKLLASLRRRRSS